MAAVANSAEIFGCRSAEIFGCAAISAEEERGFQWRQ
jgi:hypothetical protein